MVKKEISHNPSRKENIKNDNDSFPNATSCKTKNFNLDHVYFPQLNYIVVIIHA